MERTRRKILAAGAAATAMAVMPRVLAQQAGPGGASHSPSEDDPIRAMAGSRTAPTLFVEVLRMPGAPSAAAERYGASRGAELLRHGFQSGSLFHLRRQQVPAERIGDDVYMAAFQFASEDAVAAGAKTGMSERRAPAAAAIITQAIYAKLADYGRPNPHGAAGPRSAMIVFSHPTDPAYDALFNEWYTQNHMIDVGKSPHFRSATRYGLRLQGAGAPLPYLCVYEIDHEYTDELFDWMMNWLRAPDDFRQPNPAIPGNRQALTLVFWGYYKRVWGAQRGSKARS